MDDLTQEQIEELQAVLLRLQQELEKLLDVTRSASRPVDLDEPIGRLTRMDAIQQQSMTVAQRQRHDIRLRQVRQALAAIQGGTYGLCRRCAEPIGGPRLHARPESPYCLDCQDEIDRKYDSR
jgi:DnaK suppressor protein